MGVVDNETLTSDDEIVGVTEFDAKAASRTSDDGITGRKRSAQQADGNY